MARRGIRNLLGKMVFAVLKRPFCVVLLSVLATAIPVAMLSGPWRRAQDRAREAVCAGKLYSIAAALRDYHALHGRLPPAHIRDSTGTARTSWRVLLCDCLGPGHFKTQYDFAEPWNSQKNRLLLDHAYADVFQCPSAPEVAARECTSYVAVIGEHTLWPGPVGRGVGELEDADGKVLLIEIGTSEILWTEPRDFTIQQAVQVYHAEREQFRGGKERLPLHYVTVGGQVGEIRSIETVQRFLSMLQIEGGFRNSGQGIRDR